MLKQNVQTLDIDTIPEYKKFMKNGIVKIGDEEIDGDNNLTKMLYARQLCSVYNKDKMRALEELLAQAGDEPVLIFYNWTAEFEKIKELCEKSKKPISVVNGQKKDFSGV